MFGVRMPARAKRVVKDLPLLNVEEFESRELSVKGTPRRKYERNRDTGVIRRLDNGLPIRRLGKAATKAAKRARHKSRVRSTV